MKVLVAIPYFYDPKHQEFSKTPSGFGYMLTDILNSTSNNDIVYVFTHQFSDGFSENFKVVKHKKIDVLKALRIGDLLQGINDAVKNLDNINTALHYLYYQINKGSFFKTIKEIKPDIVHIHGLTYQTRPFINVCIELNQKFLVTLHGLNGINTAVLLPDVEKIYEKEELERLAEKYIPVTVVSSGIYKKIKDVYGIKTDNIRVILNGTKFLPQDILENRGNRFEIVCIGTICFRKNQIQLIDAVRCLPRKYKDRIHITFVGESSDGIDMKGYITSTNLEQIADYKGFVPREQMPGLWRNANLNVVMSKEEGFGLSMIEGFMYGVPTLTFSDLDAIKDLYNEEAFELFETRGNEDVCKGLVKCMERNFNRKKIIAWGKNFSMDNISLKYSELYKEILRG